MGAVAVQLFSCPFQIISSYAGMPFYVTYIMKEGSNRCINHDMRLDREKRVKEERSEKHFKSRFAPGQIST